MGLLKKLKYKLKKEHSKKEQIQEKWQELGAYPLKVDVKALPERKHLWLIYKFALFSIISICISGIIALTVYLKIPMMRIEPEFITWNESKSKFVYLSKGDISSNILQIPQNLIIYEDFIYNYIKKMYTISDDAGQNEKNWCDCENKEYQELNSKLNEKTIADYCFICKNSSKKIYDIFKTKQKTSWEQKAELGLTRDINVLNIKYLNSIREPNYAPYTLWEVWFSVKLKRNNLPLKQVDVWKAVIGITQQELNLNVVSNTIMFTTKSDYILENYNEITNE